MWHSAVAVDQLVILSRKETPSQKTTVLLMRPCIGYDTQHTGQEIRGVTELNYYILYCSVLTAEPFDYTTSSHDHVPLVAH